MFIATTHDHSSQGTDIKDQKVPSVAGEIIGSRNLSVSVGGSSPHRTACFYGAKDKEQAQEQGLFLGAIPDVCRFNLSRFDHGLPDGSAVSLGGAHVTITDAQQIMAPISGL